MTRDTLQGALEALGRNYNRHHLWAAESLDQWFHLLVRYSDADLKRATAEVLRTRKRCPTVATIKDLIDANPNHAPTTAAEGCGACDGTGYREVAHWYTSRGARRVTMYLAGCDCPKGAPIASGPAGPWAELVTRLQADPFTEAVYHGTQAEPHLTREQRTHPDDLARIEQSQRPQGKGSWHQLTGVE